ncbi:MAG: helix-turn-helix domain-containing protein, partial [Candidatus Hydrothermarchaeales archaeon]
VSRLLKAKELLGIEGLIHDGRGPKAPWKYIGDVRNGVMSLLKKYPEKTDHEIAEEASKNLEMSISRSAVARIRVDGRDVIII